MQYFGFDRLTFGFDTLGFETLAFGAVISPDAEILALFAGGKQGVWYDPSDITTLFKDAAGITPVAASGAPVGLVLDKSQGLEGAVTNVAKPFIADGSNAYLETTNTPDGTKLVIKGITTATQLSIFEVGKTYRLSVVYSIPESSNDIRTYNTSSGVSNFLFIATKGVRNKAEITLTARSPVLYFRASEGEITIHEVVLKEINGNHASQTLSAARPIYKTDGALHWLEFDGVDDHLLTTSNAIGSGAFVMFVAVHVDASTTAQMDIIEASSASGLNGGRINYYQGNYAFQVGNGTRVSVSTNGAGKKVLTLVYDGSQMICRANGIEVGRRDITGYVPPGGVTQIGREKEGFGHVKGVISGIVVRRGVMTADEITKTEQYLAAKSGVAL